jgi:hypothetical protein
MGFRVNTKANLIRDSMAILVDFPNGRPGLSPEQCIFNVWWKVDVYRKRMWPHFNPEHVCDLPQPLAQLDRRLSKVLCDLNMTVPTLSWVRATYPTLSLPMMEPNNSLEDSLAATTRVRRPKALRPSSSTFVQYNNARGEADSMAPQVPVVFETTATPPHQQPIVAKWSIPPFPPHIQGSGRSLLHLAMPINTMKSPYYQGQDAESMNMKVVNICKRQYSNALSFQLYPHAEGMDLGSCARQVIPGNEGPRTLPGATQQSSVTHSPMRQRDVLGGDFFDQAMDSFPPNPPTRAPGSSRASIASFEAPASIGQATTPLIWNDRLLDIDYSYVNELTDSIADTHNPQAIALYPNGKVPTISRSHSSFHHDEMRNNPILGDLAIMQSSGRFDPRNDEAEEWHEPGQYSVDNLA